MAGHSSVAQPCSVMSGHTPTAMSWSMARSTSTATPLRAMMPLLMSINPSVLLVSGDRLSVQLTNSARKSSNAMIGDSFRPPPVQHGIPPEWTIGNNPLMSRIPDRPRQRVVSDRSALAATV